jgi:ATP-dependent helicase/nuclease subunit B
MELYFGVAADGRTYPDAPSPAGALDAAVVGPAGLVASLEGQLGLAGPPASRAVRIAAYLAKLRAASSNGRFWCQSFEKDPWSTAATLLAWRDGLVSAGWTQSAVGTVRVDDLAVAEAAGPPIPPGLLDRAVALLAAIPGRPGLRLCRLVLLEPRASLPPLWARLVDALETRGVEVHVLEGNAPAAEGCDLRRVQDAVASGGGQPLQGDGTFVMLQADTALLAAEAVADWIAAGPSEALEGTIVVAPDGDTALLDRALRTRGLPALGLSAPSPWRGALQVLPLAFAVSWAPLDTKALLNLLMLPRPPMPRFAAGRLARALTSEPGINGRAWEAAWEVIAERAREQGQSSGQDAPGAVEAQVARWRAWTAAARFDRTAGIPLAEARLIAGRVSAWAMQADAGVGDPLLLGAANAAGALIAALEELGLDLLPALLCQSAP